MKRRALARHNQRRVRNTRQRLGAIHELQIGERQMGLTGYRGIYQETRRPVHPWWSEIPRRVILDLHLREGALSAVLFRG